MTMTKIRKAVVLLSGGLDSTTCVAIAKEQGFDVVGLSFDYGQRHTQELEAAVRVARKMGLKNHVTAKIDLRVFGGSALTDDIDVPKGQNSADIAAQTEGEIPVTYVPARNTIFLSFALAYAETQGSSDIFIGVNALDFSGYPDCRPEYIAAFQTLANLATKSGVEGEETIKIHTPLIDLTKADIVRKGLSLGVDYSLTTSCYDPAKNGAACGRCDACHLRLKGFREAGQTDPVAYVNSSDTEKGFGENNDL